MRKNLQQLDLFNFPETTPDKSEENKAPQAAEPIVSSEKVLFSDNPVTVIAKKSTPAASKKPFSQQPNKRGRKSFRDIDNEVDLVEIPDEEILKQKLYYPISEVAAWFKVNTSLLRYWENEFDILQPRKTKKGDRLFRIEDIRNLKVIYHLLRHKKFSIEGARSYLKTHKAEAETQTSLIQSLNKFKSFLLELKANLNG